MADMHALSVWIAHRLLDGSVQGVLLVGFVWLVCRRVSSIPASAQAWLWWLASLKLMLVLLSVPALPLPVLPAGALDTLGPDSGVPPVPVVTIADPAPLAAGDVRAVDPVALAAPEDRVRWLTLLVGVWLACVAAQGFRLIQSLRRLRGIVRRSTRLDGEDSSLARRLAGILGLTFVPEVRSSDEIDVPQVVGLRHPVILFPAVATSLAPEEREMALCHELMHVRRRDLAMGWVPALAERLFFFHPLARLAAREYVLAREAACDAAVVRALDVAPTDYGRLLLRLGVARSEPALAAGGASPSISSLTRRLTMLHHTAFGGGPRRSTWVLIALMALALLPFQLVARTPDPASPGDQPVALPAGALDAPGPLGVPAEQETVTAPQPVEEQVENARRTLDELNRLQVVEIAKAMKRQRTDDFLQEQLAQAREAQTEVEKTLLAKLDELDKGGLQDVLARITEQQKLVELQQITQIEQESLIDQLSVLRSKLDAVGAQERQSPDQERIRELERLLNEVGVRVNQKKGQLLLDQDKRELAERLQTKAGSVKLREPQSLEAQASMITAQLERLTRAQEQLIQQHEQLRRAQEQLIATQRELAAQAERLREAMQKTPNNK